MKRYSAILIAAAAFVLGAVAMAGVGMALAEGPGPNGQGWGPFGGMMGGNGYGMMGGSGGGMMGGNSGGMMGGNGSGGMMGGWAGQNGSQGQGTPISIDRAQQAIQSYVDATGNKDLAVDEIMEFQNNFYGLIKEKSTDTGAFEVLVNKYKAATFPEPGPSMMWNTKYSIMAGYGNGMDSMMRGWSGTNQNQDSGTMTVTAEQAQNAAQTWLAQNQAGSTTEKPVRFYGYYTVHILKDGKPSGMLSVNGYTGQVWYHNWHGAFVQEREVAR